MQTKKKLRRGAYTAVGAPVAGYKAAKEQVGKLAESIDETRRNVKVDVTKEFEQWVAEGEVVVDRMLDWLRSSGMDTDIRSFRRAATKKVRSGIDEITKRVDDALDYVEPEIELNEIRGIGPASVDKLAKAGVSGISSFLRATSTDHEVEKLAKKTGIAVASLREWRERADLTRIDGIGEAYQRLLHAVGIGTLTHLLNAEASDVVESIEQIERPGMPEQNPSRADVSLWITKASKLDLSS